MAMVQITEQTVSLARLDLVDITMVIIPGQSVKWQNLLFSTGWYLENERQKIEGYLGPQVGIDGHDVFCSSPLLLHRSLPAHRYPGR